MTGLVVHEWLEQHGGAERVVDAMLSAYPTSDVACLWNDGRDLGQSTIRESWLARTPLRRSKAMALPIMPFVWAGVDLREYEWALVSSHLFAHHVAGSFRRGNTPVFVYVHTPARYIWEPELDVRGNGLIAKAAAPLLKSMDRRKAASGATFAANSAFVRDRIRRTWDQDASVIYPPVSVSKLQAVGSWASQLRNDEQEILEGLPTDFVLGASRFVPYKNLQRVIEVGEACELPVVLAGSGPAEGDLRALARSSTVPVHFVSRPSDALLYALYQRAMLYVFPPIEDFGIMPVEAMALGTPVLVNAVGGAAESVSLLGGGALLPPNSSKAELKESVSLALNLDMEAVMQRSSTLSEDNFVRRLRTWMSLS